VVTLIVVDIDESGSGPVDNGRAEEHDVVPGGDEVQGAQVGDQVPSQAAGVVEVGLPRIFRTVELMLFHAASCRFRYSSWTSCGA